MTGRIKVLDANGEPLVADNTPAIPYEYDEPSEFDRICNTFGLEEWQLPNQFCPNRFVCEAESAPTPQHTQFAECIEAMNCNMMAGMTTNVGMNEIALFNYHMIPHHENGKKVNATRESMPSLFSFTQLSIWRRLSCLAYLATT